MEMVFTPNRSAGTNQPSRTAGSSTSPIIHGTLGPVISASKSPTRLPKRAKAQARFTETVVLPTPPLPLAIATAAETAANPCPCDG